MDSLVVQYKWIASDGSAPGKADYAEVLNGYIRASEEKPVVYRWALFRDPAKPYAIYIGETENLRRRLRSYLRPGKRQKTSLRLKAHFESEITKGARLELQTLRFEPFRVNNVLVMADSLHNPYVRLMLESFLLADHDDVECEILNLKMNPIERRKRRAVRALEQLTPEERRRVFEKGREMGLLPPKG